MGVDFVRYRYRDGALRAGTAARGGLGVRHIQALYTLAALATLYATRIGVIVTSLLVARERGWCHMRQALVFCAYACGTCAMAHAAHVCHKRINAKYVLFAVLLLNGTIALLIPDTIHRYDWLGACVAQLALGGVHAWTLASVDALTMHWVPPQEMNTLGAIVYAGAALGASASFPLCGRMSTSALGWPLITRMWGVVSLSMAAIWLTLTSATPREHPAIADEERDFIEESVRRRTTAATGRLLPKRGFVAHAFAHVAVQLLCTQLLFALPIHLLRHMQLPQMCWCLFAPLVVMCIVSALMTHLTVPLYHNTILSYIISITTYRKAINMAGGALACGGLVLVFVFVQTTGVALAMATIGGAIGIKICGYMECITDTSASNGGTITRASNNIGEAVCCIVPILDALLLDTQMSGEVRWWFVCVGSACACVLCDVMHSVYASAENQFQAVDTDDFNEMAETIASKSHRTT